MRIKNIIKKILHLWPFSKFSLLKGILETRGTAGQITLKTWIIQKIFGFNKEAYWPVHHSSIVSNSDNIKIGIGTAPGLSPGCYIQGMNGIEIGNYTIIAPNVGIVSANHEIYDYRQFSGDKIKIGAYCWLGMGSVVLSGVTLGDHTIVAAGAIVNSSFTDGYCIVGGVPAKVIKYLNKDLCIDFEYDSKYYGYIPEKSYYEFRKNKLKI